MERSNGFLGFRGLITQASMVFKCKYILLVFFFLALITEACASQCWCFRNRFPIGNQLRGACISDIVLNIEESVRRISNSNQSTLELLYKRDT